MSVSAYSFLMRLKLSKLLLIQIKYDSHQSFNMIFQPSIDTRINNEYARKNEEKYITILG